MQAQSCSCSPGRAQPRAALPRYAARPAVAALRQDRSSSQLGRRLPRRSAEQAVEPASAVGTTAAERAAVGAPPLRLSTAGSSSSSLLSTGRPDRLRVAVDVDEGVLRAVGGQHCKGGG